MIIQPGLCKIEGFVKIHDPKTGEVLVDKKNAIHYENISLAMAQTLSDRNVGYIYEMAFGNGGSSVDPTGVITYLPPNTTGQNAGLYNETYSKVVDDNSAANTDPETNYMSVLHTSGAIVRTYTIRNKCKVYVHQDFKDEVKVEPRKKPEKFCPHCGHDINA